MRYKELALLLILSPAAFAARIVSDPYIATVNQPDQCGYIEGAGAAVMSAVEVVTGGKRCSIDVNALPPGAHSLKVFARSAVWGDSVQVPFSYTGGAPVAPAGLRLVQ